MLFHKCLYNVQHWRKVKVVCLCMSDLVKNLRNVPNVSLSYETLHQSGILQIAIHVQITILDCKNMLACGA